MEQTLPKVSRDRLVDDVRRSLEDAILSGKIQPGERLAETWLADQLQVSRTTVREALLMLERERHVVCIPRRGTYVVRLSSEDALDLGLVRSLLEAYAATIACQRLTGDWLAEMEARIEEMQACRLPDDLPRLIQIDLAFHRAVVERTGSQRLNELHSSLDGQIGALYVRAVEKYQADNELVGNVHRQLLVAIRSQDPAVAQRAVIEHYISDQNVREAAEGDWLGVVASLAGRLAAALA